MRTAAPAASVIGRDGLDRGRPSMVATASSDAPGAGAISTPALVATVGGLPADVPALEAVTRHSIVAPTSAEPVR